MVMAVKYVNCAVKLNAERSVLTFTSNYPARLHFGMSRLSSMWCRLDVSRMSISSCVPRQSQKTKLYGSITLIIFCANSRLKSRSCSNVNFLLLFKMRWNTFLETAFTIISLYTVIAWSKLEAEGRKDCQEERDIKSGTWIEGPTLLTFCLVMGVGWSV